MRAVCLCSITSPLIFLFSFPIFFFFFCEKHGRFIVTCLFQREIKFVFQTRPAHKYHFLPGAKMKIRNKS